MTLTDELVGAMARLAGAAVEQGVREAGDMTCSHPCLRIHDDRGVEADIVGAFLNELLEPRLFDVVFKLNAEGAVVPGVCEAAVYLASGIYIASVFAQGNDLVHSLFAFFHFSVLSRGWLPQQK